MRKIIALIKKYWLLSLLIASALLILISALLRVLTPPIPTAPLPAIIQNNPDDVVTSFASLRFTGSSPELPPELGVYSVAQLPLTENKVVQDLTRSFALDPDPTLENIWRGNTRTLSKNSVGEYMLITNNGSYPAEFISQATAVQTARQFINEYFPDVPVAPVESDIQYLGGTYELDPVTRNRATVLVIPFSYAVEAYPVLYNRSIRHPFVVTVSASYEVQKIVFDPLFISLTPTVQYQTISTTDAVANIQNGIGTLIDAYRNEHGELSLAAVTSGTLTSAEVQYRVDDTQQYAYPYYSFDGEFVNSQGVTFSGTVITPAILTEL